jgi:hypothetical protein
MKYLKVNWVLFAVVVTVGAGLYFFNNPNRGQKRQAAELQIFGTLTV